MIPRAGRDGKRRIDHVCPHGLKADSVDGLFHFTHHAGSRLLEHDVIRWNRHHALALCLSMIFFGKPVSTFPDHALTGEPWIGVCSGKARRHHASQDEGLVAVRQSCMGLVCLTPCGECVVVVPRRDLAGDTSG